MYIYLYFINKIRSSGPLIEMAIDNMVFIKPKQPKILFITSLPAMFL